MTFNELNSVEHFIIHQLSGVNLNAAGVAEGQATYGAQWQYRSPDDLDRGVNEVLVESELHRALIRINPEIQENPELADEVIYKLRAILISVNQTGWSGPMKSSPNGCRAKRLCPLAKTTAMCPFN